MKKPCLDHFLSARPKKNTCLTFLFSLSHRFKSKEVLNDGSKFCTTKELEGTKMKILSDIKPITYLKTKAAALLDQVNETHRPVVITQNGEPNAVLQDAQSYDAKCLGNFKTACPRGRRCEKGKNSLTRAGL
jgi:prevent-host-death family protein